MRKHIYLHTSNLENAQEFSDDLCFEPAYMYCHQIKNISPYEWGRIKTEAYYYHIMLGTIRNDNCPWCGTKPELKKLHDYLSAEGMTPERPSSFCMQCSKCGSIGPITQVNEPVMKDDKFIEWIENMIKMKYATRLHWDHDFKNPYEEPK